MTDDFKFDLFCTPLKPSLEIAFASCRKATHVKKEPGRLTLAWHVNAGEGFVPLVTPITAETAETFVRSWLSHEADYGQEPDSDGTPSRSWHIWVGTWGHVDSNHYAFCAIEPYWATYSK